MKILIIRHADPDYTIDSLTEKGKKEAELLSQRLIKSNIKRSYVSPLGRAKHTAEYTLKKLGKKATVCDWLREFHAPINRPDKTEKIIPWDWYPTDWTKTENFFDTEKWGKNPIMEEGKVAEEYTRVTNEFDKILASHGYVRNGKLYNDKTGIYSDISDFVEGDSLLMSTLYENALQLRLCISTI